MSSRRTLSPSRYADELGSVSPFSPTRSPRPPTVTAFAEAKGVADPPAYSAITKPLAGRVIQCDKLHAFSYDATYHTVDIHPELVADVNGKQSYVDVVNSGEKPYHLSVPWEPFLFTGFKQARVDFMLGSETTSIIHFVQEHKSSDSTGGYKPIDLKADFTQLQQAMGLKSTHSNGYHILPVHIDVIDVYSSLPVTMSAKLFTNQAVKPDTGSSTTAAPVEWKSPCSALQQVNTVYRNGGKSNGVVFAPRAKHVPEKMGVIYTADNIVSDSDFPRWISADVINLKRQLRGMTPVLMNSVPLVMIMCPPVKEDGQPVMVDSIFWFVVAHIEEIKTATANHFMDRDINFDVQKVNHIFSNEQGLAILVPQAVLLQVLKDKECMYEKDRLLMNLESMHLQIEPVLRNLGWKEMEDIGKELEATKVGYDEANYARLRVSVRIIYQEYNDRQR
jgi:hypothetical protein